MNPILLKYLKTGFFQFILFFLVMLMLDYDKSIDRLILFSFIQSAGITTFNYFYETRKK